MPALALLLAGYLFLGKTFAYVHVPWTAFFIGEVVLLIGLVEVLDVRSPWRRLLRVSPALVVAGCFVGVCAFRLLNDLPQYGIDAVRDASIWYYAVFMFLVAAMVVRRPDAVRRLAGWYRRAIPAFLVWAPIAVVLANLPALSRIHLPGTPTRVNAFPIGDLAVQSAMAVAFLWLAPDRDAAPAGLPPRRPALGRRARRSHTSTAVVALSCTGIVALLVCGTQTRGGFLAGATTLLVAAAWLPAGRKRRLGFSIGAGLLATLLVVVVFDVRIGGLARDRDVSLEQIALNVTSIADRSGSEELEGTEQWRSRLWSHARVDLTHSHAWLTGVGYGPVLGIRYGVSRPESPAPLRSAHNSHLSILVRAGLVAAGLWVLLWAVWAAGLLALLLRSSRGVRDPMTALAAWLLAAAAGILVNAYFDPSLETPEGAVWAYVLLGLGAVVARHKPSRGPLPRRMP